MRVVDVKIAPFLLSSSPVLLATRSSVYPVVIVGPKAGKSPAVRLRFCLIDIGPFMPILLARSQQRVFQNFVSYRSSVVGG